MKSRLVDVIAKMIGKKKTLKKGYSMHPGIKWKGKAKDYPGMSNIIKRNKLKVVPININKKK